MSWNQTRSRQFDAPVIEYLDRLYSYARILVRNLAEAENLVHETCLRAMYEPMDRLQASDGKRWLFTVLRDIWLRRQRDSQLNESRGHDDPGNDIVAPSATSLDPSVCQSETEHLRVALQRSADRVARDCVLAGVRRSFAPGDRRHSELSRRNRDAAVGQSASKAADSTCGMESSHFASGERGTRGPIGAQVRSLFFSRTELARRTVN